VRLSTPPDDRTISTALPPSPAPALPTRTLNNAFTFYHDSEEVILQGLPPAHTDTDLFVYFRNANVIHAGDAFFNGFYPVIDYSTGGSANGYVDGMAKLMLIAKDSTKIIPGHGPLGSKAELVSAHDMLATVRDRVAAAKKSSKSLEENDCLEANRRLRHQMGQRIANARPVRHRRLQIATLIHDFWGANRKALKLRSAEDTEPRDQGTRNGHVALELLLKVFTLTM
jgi:glyoxylase-like metal-dependent hydrolase (beta-lactamase superfamily II)